MLPLFVWFHPVYLDWCHLLSNYSFKENKNHAPPVLESFQLPCPVTFNGICHQFAGSSWSTCQIIFLPCSKLATRCCINKYPFKVWFLIRTRRKFHFLNRLVHQQTMSSKWCVQRSCLASVKQRKFSLAQGIRVIRLGLEFCQVRLFLKCDILRWWKLVVMTQHCCNTAFCLI